MQLIEPSFEILEQGNTINDIYKHIEFCGRTCYKSTDKIDIVSAKPFVTRMLNSKHYAMLEHGTVYLTIHKSVSTDWSTGIRTRYKENKYSKVINDNAGEIYITTNLRVIAENDWWDDLEYLCAPTKYHAKRYTVKFICNRQVSHEFVRHRVFSFAQESTRYCNYSKDKFGNELTFIKPCWFRPDSEWKFSSHTTPELLCVENFNMIEQSYNLLTQTFSWQAQQCATILPNALKTELIMTGFAEDWEHFFDLRALGKTGAPHPQAKQLAMPLYEEFINRGYINAR